MPGVTRPTQTEQGQSGSLERPDDVRTQRLDVATLSQLMKCHHGCKNECDSRPHDDEKSDTVSHRLLTSPKSSAHVRSRHDVRRSSLQLRKSTASRMLQTPKTRLPNAGSFLFRTYFPPGENELLQPYARVSKNTSPNKSPGIAGALFTRIQRQRICAAMRGSGTFCVIIHRAP